MDELDRFRTFRSDPATLTESAEADARVRLLHEMRVPAPWYRRRSARKLTLATSAGALALAGLAATALIVPSGSGPSVVERARAALAPAGDEILHVRRTTTTSDPAQGTNVMETWVRTSAPYPHRTAIVLTGHGDKAHELEATSLGDYGWGYDEATNTLRRIDVDPPEDATPPVDSDSGSASQVNLPMTIAGLDPAKQLLEQGRATVVAETKIDGRKVYKVAFADDVVPANEEMAFYVDRETYLPVLEESTIVLPDGRRIISRTAVVFERLPATPENLALLSLRAQYPTATIGAPTTDVDLAQGIKPAASAP